jgi:hypothetical protein
MKGKLDLLNAATKVASELMSIPEFGEEDGQAFAAELKAVHNMKKAVLLVAGAAVQKLMMNLQHEQEIIMHIADMAITAFHAESALLRIMKLSKKNNTEDYSIQQNIVGCYLYDAADKIHKSGKDAVYAFTEGDDMKMLLLGLKRFTRTPHFNSKEARRRIADMLIEKNSYFL